MLGKTPSIVTHNVRVMYGLDLFRAMWFITSVWVAFERQFITLSQLTIVEALAIAVALIMQLPTGAFADLLGKKKALIIGSITFSAAMVFYSISTTMGMFVIYAVLFGVASAFFDGTREALMYDTLKQEHMEHRFAFFSSKLSLIFQISLAGAAIVGGLLGSVAFEYAIWATALAHAIAAVISCFLREPDIDTEKFTWQAYMGKTVLGVKELVKNSYIRKVSLYYILIGSLTYVCSLTFNMVLLTEMKFTTTEIGITSGTARILVGILLFSLISVTSFFTRKRTFMVLPLIMFLSFTPAVFLSKWFVIIPFAGALFVSNSRWNILGRYTNAEFASQNRTTAISALNMIIGIFYVIVVGASGFIMDRFGGIRTIYTMLGIASAVFILPLGLHLAKHHGQE